MEYKHLYPLVKSSSFEGFVLKSRISVKCVCEATHCGFIFLSWKLETTWISSSSRWFCCCCSVANSCLTLCDPMDWSMPGFPVLHCPLEFAQSHVHWVSDANQPRPLLSVPFSSCLQFFPASRAFSMSWLFASGTFYSTSIQAPDDIIENQLCHPRAAS